MSQPPRKLAKILSRQPFVGLALATGIGILCADFHPGFSWLLLGALVLFLVFSLLWARSLWTYGLVTVGFFLLHTLNVTDTPGVQFAQEMGDQPQSLTAHGIVVSEPKHSPTGYASFVLQLKAVDLAGETNASNATIFVRSKGAARFGDEMRLFGLIEPVPPPRNPGEFDMRSYLARHDIHRQLVVSYEGDSELLRHSTGNVLLATAQASRAWMQTALERGLDDSPAVCGMVTGMVLGVRHQTPEDIEEPFQQTGTLHLFAVAGLHVGIVAQLLWIVATVGRFRRRLAILLIIPALLFYAAITGLHISSVRAALMSSIVLGGFLAERKAFTPNSLAAASVLILSWDTNELFSLGFQLSFCVVTAIVLLAEPLFQLLYRQVESDRFIPRSLFSRPRKAVDHLMRGVARGMSVSLAAWLGSLPLMLWYYSLVTPISLLANLIVVPIAFFVLAGGLLSIITSALSPGLSIVYNNANWLLAQLILGVVHLFAWLPAGHFYAELPDWKNKVQAEVTVLDVGTGAATHIRTHTSNWLVDTGSERDFKRTVRTYLHIRGINRIDGLVLTHGDSGHIGGGRELLEEFQPRELIDRGLRDRSPSQRALLATLETQKIPRLVRTSGDTLQLSSNVNARILFPPKGFTQKAADDQTFVIQLFVNGQSRVLFTSDSGEATEHYLLKSDANLRSDIIVKGQHRSGISGSSEFLDRVRPQLIIATSRDFPNSERITDEWTETLRKRGIKLFRQDETGAVKLRLFQSRWEAIAYRTAEIFRSTS